MKWIELETVLAIHNRVIESTGGSYGLRDEMHYGLLVTLYKQH